MFIPVTKQLPEVIHTTDRNGFAVIESIECVVKSNKGKHAVMVHGEYGWEYNPHSGNAPSIREIEEFGEIIAWKYVV